MEYPRYYGNYVGIVVANNDPQYRGRVKVFVPHISPTVYKGWNDTNTDKNFNFIGQLSTNNSSTLTNAVTGTGSITPIVEDLKKILPWAEISAPLTGGGSSGRYNATTGFGSISDSNNLDYTQASPLTPYSQNADGLGEKPGNIYDQSYVRLSDAFSNPQLTNVNNVNKLSYEYIPEAYSNSAKGAFPVLNVGAHVWVFFNEGDPLKPVVFGSSYGANDWSTIFNASSGNPGIDYPGTYENIVNEDPTDINVRTYRNKYVINQKGGTLSFVNTDNREVLKMTHYSGSFKEFNNQANIELATANDQKLVLGDSFSTVRNNRNEFTQRDYDSVVVGDHYRKVGNLDFSLYQKWKNVMESFGIPNTKQLFDIQRTTGVVGLPAGESSLIKLNGTGQTRTGTPYPCPMCAAGDISIFTINDSYDPPNFKTVVQAPGYNEGALNSAATVSGFLLTLARQGKTSQSPQGRQPYPSLIKANQVNTDFDGKINLTAPGVLHTAGGKSYPCPFCNPASPNNKSLAKSPGIIMVPGLSPSSFQGAWLPDPQKALLKEKYISALPILSKLEAEMGPGGSEIIEITKHKIETIGMVMNDWGAIRVDPYGKFLPAYVDTTPYCTLPVNRPSPLIEQVQVDDLPGGTYTLNVCNKYNIMVGAGGVNLKSYGVVNITGAMTNIAGEQVNIGSANEVNIDGGKRLSLTGDIVSIGQRYGEQVLIDSDLGVSGNAVIKGALHIEGHLSALSISHPPQIHISESNQTSARGISDRTVGVAIPMDQYGTLDSNGQLRPGSGGVAYMGYTDTTKIVGYLPVGTVITGPCTGLTSPAGAVTGTASITTTTALAVYGSGNTNLSLRGLPISQVNSIINSAKNGDSAATKAPFITIGAGSHPEAVRGNPHNHTVRTAGTVDATGSRSNSVVQIRNDNSQATANNGILPNSNTDYSDADTGG